MNLRSSTILFFLICLPLAQVASASPRPSSERRGDIVSSDSPIAVYQDGRLVALKQLLADKKGCSAGPRNDHGRIVSVQLVRGSIVGFILQTDSGGIRFQLEGGLLQRLKTQDRQALPSLIREANSVNIFAYRCNGVLLVDQIGLSERSGGSASGVTDRDKKDGDKKPPIDACVALLPKVDTTKLAFEAWTYSRSPLTDENEVPPLTTLLVERERIQLIDFYNADPQLREFFNLEIKKLNYLIALGNFWSSIQSRLQWGIENTPYNAEDPFEMLLAEGMKSGIAAEGMGEIGRQWLRAVRQIKGNFALRQKQLLTELSQKYNYPFYEIYLGQAPARKSSVPSNQRQRTISLFVLYRAQKIAVEHANLLPSEMYRLRANAIRKVITSTQADPKLNEYLGLLLQEWGELIPVYQGMEEEARRAGLMDDLRSSIMSGNDPLEAMLGLFMNDSQLSRDMQRINDKYASAFERTEKKYDIPSVILLKQLESCYKYAFLAAVYSPSSREITPSDFTSDGVNCKRPTGSPTTINVIGNQPVTRTGIRLCKGDFVRLKAWGSIVVGPVVGSTGPNGIDTNLVGSIYNYLPEALHGALLYQIGEAREDGWLYAGSQSAFVADKPGELLFTVNDRDFKNNQGSFTVTIEIYR